MEIICLTVHFLLLYLSVFSSASNNNNASYADEQALLVFKKSITSDPHKTLSTWTTNTNFCTWIGITCNLVMRVSSIDIGSRGLMGYISPFVGNLSLLEKLNISNNTFQGGIPPELGHKLGNLQELYLWGNQLSGPIPASIGNCSKLVLIGLSFNKISGEVPLELGKLISLQRLMLDNNRLTSTRNLPFLTALLNCSALQTLYLGFNHLTGVLPLSIGKLSSRLSVLSLPDNYIGGNIPQQIGNLTRLTLINFTSNFFTGTIPSSLGRLEILERLYLGKNQLEGNIPSEICVLGRRLGLLSISSNQLSGKIPEIIGNLIQLRYIYLDQNQLEGTIPASLGKCWLLELVDLSHNKLTGNVPAEVTGLLNLQFYFNLSWNSLQGRLPPFSMPMIQGIDLSGNKLSGTIPKFPSPELEFLNLSHNLFEGTVTGELLSRFSDMQYIDLTYINLSGIVSTCGGLLFTPACPNRGKSGNPVAGQGPTGFRGKTGRHLHFDLKYVYVTVAIIDFIATNGFGKGNLLGVGSVGSVYKGVLANGTLVAVKVLNLQDNSAYNSFSIECQVLSKAIHRNLIRVLTSCSNLDIKALVLEFMCNGNLEKQLHCDSIMCNIGGVCKMNLQTRLQIAIDIARGLAYLHHDCSIQVIHCDLKPGNVLLDYYMTAHVADFGNAQILSENSMHTVSSPKTIQGTLGYIAPEYGVSANVSTKGDVYSYGILLLEILTKKRPTDQMFVEGLSLRMWVSMVFPHRIAEVIDYCITHCNGGATDERWQCLIEMTRVALLCTKASPKDRPSMAQVVEFLESIETKFEGSKLDSKYPSDPYQMLDGTTNRVNAVSGHSTSTWPSTS